MARDEQSREDLLAEATNLVERVSLRLCTPLDSNDEVVAGFRRDGSLAIYFGQERVYQFTSVGELRRAYVDGLLYKAQRGNWIVMRRERTSESLHLVSSPLNEADTSHFLRQMQCYLQHLKWAIATQAHVVLGQVPADGKQLAMLLDWLQIHGGNISIANSPRSA
jgi:hypothetical protein